MNSDEIWLLQLWSGTIGAAISAVAAAAVAILVVRLSSRHQSRLADLQLKEQRDEATRQRTIFAIADMLAAVNEFRTTARADVTDIWAVHHRSHSAALRWYVEDRAAGTEAVAWAHHLLELASAVHSAQQDIGGSHTWQLAIDSVEWLTARTEALTVRAVAWPHASQPEREAILAELRSIRERWDPLAFPPVTSAEPE